MDNRRNLIKIACVGDSITEGFGTTDPVTDCYPAVLGRMLEGRAEVRNFGISGFCVLDTADCPYRNTIQYEASLRCDADIVLVMLGTNDSKIANYAKHDNDFRKAFGDLLIRYQDLDSHPEVYVLTAPATWRKTGEQIWDYMVVPEIVDERIVPDQKRVAALLNCPVIDVHSVSRSWEENFQDGIHPDTEGSSKLAGYIRDHLIQVSDRLRASQQESFEEYEWGDYWVEKPRCTDRPRVLLIGDSISRGYRPFVIEQVKKQYLIDNIATSASVDSTWYRENLQRILEDPRLHYDLIQLNNGIHGEHMSVQTYRIKYEETIRYIQSVSPARLVLALSTPIWHENGGFSNEQNKMVCERNAVVADLAEKYNLPVNDLYQISLSRNMHVDDGVHYNEKGAAIQAEKVVQMIRAYLPDDIA